MLCILFITRSSLELGQLGSVCDYPADLLPLASHLLFEHMSVKRCCLDRLS